MTHYTIRHTLGQLPDKLASNVKISSLAMTARIDREQSITAQIEFNRISVENRPRVAAVRRMIAKSGVRCAGEYLFIYIFLYILSSSTGIIGASYRMRDRDGRK